MVLNIGTMSDEEREERELDLTYPEVVTKYKSAADIVNSIIFFNLYCWNENLLFISMHCFDF